MRNITHREERKIIDKAINLRHRFHEIPESSFEENKTSHLTGSEQSNLTPSVKLITRTYLL